MCGKRWDMELRHFLPNTPHFRLFLHLRPNYIHSASNDIHTDSYMKEQPHFHGKRHRNMAKVTRLRRGRQSVALLVGEKRCECRHVFKCRCGMFVAFFLTRTVQYGNGNFLWLLLYMFKKLASLLSEKRKVSYSKTMGWIRCRLSFFPSESLHHVDQRSPLISAC